MGCTLCTKGYPALFEMIGKKAAIKAYDKESLDFDKLQSATGNTEVRSSIDGVIQKIDTSKLTTEDNSSVDDTDSGDSSSDDSSSGGSNAFITILDATEILGYGFKPLQES